MNDSSSNLYNSNSNSYGDGGKSSTANILLILFVLVIVGFVLVFVFYDPLFNAPEYFPVFNESYDIVLETESVDGHVPAEYVLSCKYNCTDVVERKCEGSDCNSVEKEVCQFDGVVRESRFLASTIEVYETGFNDTRCSLNAWHSDYYLARDSCDVKSHCVAVMDKMGYLTHTFLSDSRDEFSVFLKSREGVFQNALLCLSWDWQVYDVSLVKDSTSGSGIYYEEVDVPGDSASLYDKCYAVGRVEEESLLDLHFKVIEEERSDSVIDVVIKDECVHDSKSFCADTYKMSYKLQGE